MERLTTAACAGLLVWLVAASAHAADISWSDGGAGSGWSNFLNWNGGVPNNGDQVSIGNLPAAVGDLVVLDGGDEIIASLAITSGAGVDTNHNRLVVFGPLDVFGAGSRVLVQPYSGGVALVAGDTRLQEAASLQLLGGEIRLNGPGDDVALLSLLSSASTLAGFGEVVFADTLNGGQAILLNNLGEIRSTREFGSDPTVRRTLGLAADDAGALVDLDGSNESGALRVDAQTTLRIDAPLSDAFDGEARLGPGSILDVASLWSLGGDMIVDATPAPDVADHARLEGGQLSVNTGGLVELSGGGLTFAAPLNLRTGATLSIIAADATIEFASNARLDGDLEWLADRVALTISDVVTVRDPAWDWDGPDDSATTTVTRGGEWIVDSAAIDPVDEDRFDGVLRLEGGLAEVNVTGGWTLGGRLVLDSATAGARLGGAAVTFDGEVDVINGEATLAADARFTDGSTTTLATASDRLVMEGAYEFAAGATVQGLGRVVLLDTSRTMLEHGAEFGAGVENRGRLTVGGEAVVGPYEQTALGELLLDLAPGGDHDMLIVAGRAVLGGELIVGMGTHQPILGEEFMLLTSQMLTGRFNHNLPALEEGLAWRAVYAPDALSIAVALAGDYNDDGAVDAADYTVWRDARATTYAIEADGNLDGIIDGLDYQLWADNYGATRGRGSMATPEPAAGAMFLTSLLSVIAPRRSARRASRSRVRRRSRSA